ncbi:hypothetical protein ARMGADRAFT_1086979 [Armillaria gallica]|uniref:Uncharacterized protein n=1 Tax=Armillaria gallica TaxID=47427 RepID=A0A2H3DCE9_ARMGA|nr:hypothetical protein ARMGADRAFT_1086979 [Armillaria gallica]
MPVIVLSPTTSSTKSTPYVFQSPTPLSPGTLEERLVEFELVENCYSRPATPYLCCINSNGDIRTLTNALTPFDPNDLWCPPNLWDNLALPLRLFPSVTNWDAPIPPARECTPTPVASTSHLHVPSPSNSSHSNSGSSCQLRDPYDEESSLHQESISGRLQGMDAGQALPDMEHINGIIGHGSPSLFPVLTIHKLPPTPPNTTNDA